jgi:hypothetical protein
MNSLSYRILCLSLMHLSRLPLITLWIELTADYIFELIKVSFMKYITSLVLNIWTSARWLLVWLRLSSVWYNGSIKLTLCIVLLNPSLLRWGWSLSVFKKRNILPLVSLNSSTIKNQREYMSERHLFLCKSFFRNTLQT